MWFSFYITALSPPPTLCFRTWSSSSTSSTASKFIIQSFYVSSANVPISFIQSLLKLYEKNHPNHHRRTFCPFFFHHFSQNDHCGYALDHEWWERVHLLPVSKTRSQSIELSEIITWSWTPFFFSRVENCEVVVGPWGDQQAQVCFQSWGPDVHRPRVSAAAHGWNGTWFGLFTLVQARLAWSGCSKPDSWQNYLTAMFKVFQ